MRGQALTVQSLMRALKATGLPRRSIRVVRSAKALFWESWLRLSLFLGWSPHLNPESEVVVSLASYPPRLRTASLTLETIFRQRPRVGIVHLWLAEEELSEDDLPANLRRLRKRGLQISFVTENFRSGNKLVHALSKYPQQNIIVVDDDALYPSNSLGELVQAHRVSPGAVVAHTCRYLSLDEEGGIAPYKEVFLDAFEGTGPNFNFIPVGVSGVLYPPDALNPTVHDLDLFMRLAPGNDDVWFKAMSMLNGVKTRRVAPRNPSGPLTTRRSQRVALGHQNWSGGYDYALRSVFEHFNLSHLLE